MTDSIIFQLLGLIYLIVGLGIFLNPDFYKKLLEDFSHNITASYLGGLMALIIGYFLIYYHSSWSLDWPVLITIMGWLSLIKGLVILIAPSSSFEMARKLKRNKDYLYASAGFIAIFGLIMLYLGFRTF